MKKDNTFLKYDGFRELQSCGEDCLHERFQPKTHADYRLLIENIASNKEPVNVFYEIKQCQQYRPPLFDTPTTWWETILLICKLTVLVLAGLTFILAAIIVGF